MGRKIPGRKHHGVRDPEKQRFEREKSIKHKINAPPANPDDQPVPKSVQRLAELKAKAKSGVSKRRKSKSKPKGQFERLPGESDRQFLYRVNQICSVIKHEAAFENKFGVEIVRDESGEVQDVKKKPKDPVMVMIKEAKDAKKKKKGNNNENRLSKSQKKQLKIKEKKIKKADKDKDEFSKFKDEVKFGEQAHAPPTLTVPKKFKDSSETPRPGQKDLLLKSVLNLKKNNTKVIDRTVKRKNLPTAVRRQLDKQQGEVIKAYKSLKAKKHQCS